MAVCFTRGRSARNPPADPIGPEFGELNMSEELDHIRRFAEEKAQILLRRAECGLQSNRCGFWNLREFTGNSSLPKFAGGRQDSARLDAPPLMHSELFPKK